ncbi:hypothetical protein ASILVAE211_25060 [Acidisoma silvae]|uniref:Aldolase n=2 Tax=Acidisoma silvae TaxID=2802396 RepID=A0A963YX17_9PROT|nr:hypothetical protein [Acidisoma silvae]
MTHRFDSKIARIRQGQYRPADFMIADAKDGDMSGGILATGLDYQAGKVPQRRSRQRFITHIGDIIRQDNVDIMLVSASNLELLQEADAFAGTGVKPAIRANDTTDCWGAIRHSGYRNTASHPFRSASVKRQMAALTSGKGTELGLYSITFNNDLGFDMQSLDAFAEFRRDAAACGFKYFYEVFNPNIETGLTPDALGQFMNDAILRSLAGLTRAERPEFLKIVYNGPAALEELASFDSELVVGVLGGGAGTTRDTFELIWQAERYGARLALFGRKINLAEDPLTLIGLMRDVVEQRVTPKDAVRAYHDKLSARGIVPARSLETDLTVTEDVLKSAASV